MAVTAGTPIQLIDEVYGRLPDRVTTARERMNRPLALTEKSPLTMTMGFMKDSSAYPRFEEVARKIDDAIDFMNALGLTPENTPSLRETRFYTSHAQAAKTNDACA